MSTTTEKRTRAANPELLVMARLSRTLDDLDPAARQRVLDWLLSKYGKEAESTERTRPGVGC